MLNEKTDKTEKIIHIMVTSLCKRNCKYCCNNSYNLNSIPYVTDEELKNCHTVCLTGGEPFAFLNPDEIAFYYKSKYPNIKQIYTYSNALELLQYLNKYNIQYFQSIDGLTISIKNKKDLEAFEVLINYPIIKQLTKNRLYIFNNLIPKAIGNFDVIPRSWQASFQPATDSIFRKA